jgi:hypothetical protein
VAIDPAWIGFAGGVIGTAASAVIGVRQRRDSEALTRLDSDLAAQRDERKALLDRDLRAEDVLARYREPLAAAAFDLQSRCYNILRLSFLTKFGPAHERFGEAQTTTVFRFAQYFGWTEILRRDIQFLSFPEKTATKDVGTLQGAIARRLATSDRNEPLMIWTDEQRAIGERMIVEEHGKVLCMGYARFCDEYDERFAPLCKRLLADLADPDAADRLRDVQHELCKLVETLDVDRVRYTRDLDRA